MKGAKRTYQTAFIDGQTVKALPGQTILEVAIKAGIYIPTLCHLENLEAYGACRLCVVEVKDMKGFPTACTTPLVPGMEVVTVSPALQKLRREILEFSLSEHPFTCLVCKDKNECTDFMHTTRKVSTITGCNFCTSNGDCELQELVDYLELKDMKFPITYRGIPSVKDNPFYDLDYNLCVLCGRCVRICNEERNSHVLAFVERGSGTIVGTAFNESQSEAGCEFCGACVDVCPTGSISEKMGKWRGKPDKSVKTTCVICPVACDMNVNTKDGKLVQIGPVPGKRTNPPQLCLRGKFLPAEISDHPERITTPLIKRDNKWIEVPWEKAIETITGKLEEHRESHFGVIASGQDTLEDNYILQKFTRQVMRSNNVDLHHSYPNREIPEQIHQLRVLQATAGLAEVEQADTLLLFGTDASLSHPMLENRIRKAYTKGKQVISFGALPTRTSTFATSELLYSPGGEEGLLLLLLSALDQKQNLQKIIQSAEDQSGIQVSQLETVIALLAESRKIVLVAGDDLLRQASSGNIIRLLSALHRVLSSSGRCGILFPTYEGNLYSNALAGAHPDYLPGFQQISSKTKGLTCNEMLRNTGKEGITAMMVVGDLPVHPGLDKLEFLVQCNMFKTALSEHADLLLPLPHFLESEGHILSTDNRLKKVNRVVTRPGRVKSINWIVSSLAKAMGETGFSEKPAEIMRELKPLLEIAERIGKRPGPLDLKSLYDGTSRYPVSMMILHNHFRYRGNALSKLIADLEPLTAEGTVGLSGSLMEQLKVKAGERIRIISENGAMDSMARLIPGLNGQTACFIPNGNIPSGIYGEVYPENHVVHVKIVKS